MPRLVHSVPFVIRPAADLVKQQPALSHASNMLSSKYRTSQVVTEQDLQVMGRMLWQALAVQDAFDAARQAAGAAILPVIIESAAADVQALPWETLYHPTWGFIGKHPGFTVTRRIKAAAPGDAPLEQGPLRVLLFTSLPDDVDPEWGRLDVEEEQAQVQEALLPWIAAGRVLLEMPDDGRFATLQEHLHSFQPHVLFLSGHGSFHHQPHTGQAPYGEFLFESETGQSEPVREDQIATAMIGAGVQAVILTACESSKAASDALNNGLTRCLSAQGIPHVAGMRESVYDAAGIQFARALCDAVAQGERIDVALQAARRAIQQPLQGILRREAGSAALEELSLGQWCLPMLLSSNPQQSLIDWNFSAQPPERRVFNRSLSTVTLPARFVGRRSQLRRYQSALLKGKLQKLLITGPGGQGKTALAGKLALDLRARTWHVFAWSARPENLWRDFEFELERALDETNLKRYDAYRPRFPNDAARARFLLELLQDQFQGRVALFLDNLETLQDDAGLQVSDPVVAAWLAAAQALPDLVLLATSRWQLPDWPGEHLSLERASYSDFLHMARLRLEPALWRDRDRMRRVYGALGGNPRGLEFFAGATLQMRADEEEAFLARLEQAKGELQTNMAIAEIYRRLPAAAQTLLGRLSAYHEPVPVEGVLKLGRDLAAPQALFERLWAVSLLEASREPRWDVVEYQLAPLVSDWLRAHDLADGDVQWLNAAADYHRYLYTYERRDLAQAVITHHALRRAARYAEADRLALDRVVGPLTRAGLYHTLLRDWLPAICGSPDPATRAEALGQIGKLYLHTGEYGQALGYLERSLAISEAIGDRAGEGTTLNNIGQIYKAQGEYGQALGYLERSLAISEEIGDRAGEGTTLNNIAALYHAQGDYGQALGYLERSLAISEAIGDRAGQGATLNNISQIYHAQGEYGEALGYLERSLAISEAIGDRAGLCATRFNMGHLYWQDGQIEQALSAWVRSYVIAKQINLARVLQALAALAPQVGLPGGLAGWEQLAQQRQ